MSLRRPPATLWLAALAAVAASACATQPATAPAMASASAAPAAAAAATSVPVERPAAFAVCGACHGSSADAAPSLGPNLFGVAGKKAGSAHDYDYSDALKNSGKVWTPENLAAFIEDPSKSVPDNNMDFPGVPDAATAKAIAVYMASLH